jgi:protein-S-isoprenylcysteine O-methyltransferase Ste14
MNNQHEIAMTRHWNGIAIRSRAKTVDSYRKYAKQADVWATKALAIANNTERKDAMRMTRKDNAAEVVVCLLAVAFLLTLATISGEQPVAIISYIGAGLFGIIAIAYTWQEHRYTKTYRKHLNARLDEIVEGGLDVTV